MVRLPPTTVQQSLLRCCLANCEAAFDFWIEVTLELPSYILYSLTRVGRPVMVTAVL